MRSGKSFFTDNLLKYKRLCVYNTGNTGEFKDVPIVNFPAISQKRQKLYREFELKKEKLIIRGFTKLFGNLVIDDCYSIFRNGVSAEWLNYLSKINHWGTEKNKGINTFLIFHNFNQINSCLLDYVTDFIIFKSELLHVDFRRDIGNKTQSKIEKALKLLDNAPKYSYCHINLK